ncbi:hypothetical protein pdam_00025751 [Pocillopora damicornis]|uniref:Uncharacterized protein n=1 Tax=Pocillopora damicornis TaxID=46731 RepID=A0A3M6UCV7_POCDA|nr:hypothetical protein pdam_00025751 [Pocillopora damicornis]
MHKKIRQKYDLLVTRDQVYDVMSDLDPDGLAARGGEASFFYYGSCGSERARYIQGDGVEFPQDQSPEGHSFTRWGPKPYLQFSSEIWA